jgi:hypothetical protein
MGPQPQTITSMEGWNDRLPSCRRQHARIKINGFMSNRGRQIVATFLPIDMNTDLRYGADHF